MSEKTENLLPKYPNYHICENGDLYRQLENKEWVKKRAFRRKNNPYLQYSVKDMDGVVKTKPVHYFVALAFLGERPKGMFTCHNDGDSLNNSLSNIRYDTPKSNSADRDKHGKWSLKIQGTEKEEEIKRLYFSGISVNEIKKRLNVSTPLIYRILNKDERFTKSKRTKGKAFRGRSPHIEKLDIEEMELILKNIFIDVCNGVSCKFVAEKYGMTRRHLYKILSRQTWLSLKLDSDLLNKYQTQNH